MAKSKSLVCIDDILDVYNNKWPEPEGDWYLEDCSEGWEHGPDGGEYLKYTDDGAVALKPGQMVNLNLFEASIAWQGKGEEPEDPGFPKSFVSFFKKVMGTQTHSTVSLKVPNGSLERLLTAAKELGCELNSEGER